MVNRRIVVCNKCGLIYDLHYVTGTIIEKNNIKKFRCQICGTVEVNYKNLDDFHNDEKSHLPPQEYKPKAIKYK